MVRGRAVPLSRVSEPGGCGVVVWFTGLPASGKSTLAERVRARLGRPTLILDSDVMRGVLEADGYAPDDRDRFYRELAEIAAMLARQGLVVLVAATAQRRAYRAVARRLAPRFVEVWVRTPASACARQDVKGLYARAAAGQIALPGVAVPYEPPLAPDVTAGGGLDDAAAAAIAALIEARHAGEPP
jgi:adenylylsulfate kinase